MPKLPCPMCEQPAEQGRDNAWRPFCSERCKLLDLGKWLDGDYRIPGPPAKIPEDDHTGS